MTLCTVHPISTARRPRALNRFAVGMALAGACAIASLPAMAQAVAGQESPLSNVVTLSTSGSIEVPQDWLTVRMSATKEGGDAAAVQAQLKAALESAMTIARSAALGNQQLQASSGAFGVYPRYDKNGKISSWQGNAELILQGRDFTRIARTAGQISTMTLANMVFSLSSEAQQKLEAEVQAQAIDRFKARATEVAKGFGLTGFRLREINVSSADPSGGRMVQRGAMSMESKVSFSKSESLALEPGIGRVDITVSGSVYLK